MTIKRDAATLCTQRAEHADVTASGEQHVNEPIKDTTAHISAGIVRAPELTETRVDQCKLTCWIGGHSVGVTTFDRSYIR